MTTEVVLGIQGMTCGACLASITDAVSKLDGVNQVSVSLITEEAKISYTDTQITPEALVAAVEECGFDAHLIRTSPAKPTTVNTVVGIEGMTCGACLASITEALEAVPGVSQVSISLLTNSGLIIHLSEVSEEAIKHTIEDRGFDVTSIKSTSDATTVHSVFSIQGMTCGACSSSITEALEKLEGVSSVSVSLITEEAAVVHDYSVLPDQLIQVIEDCGFDAQLKSGRSTEEEESFLQVFGINDHTDVVHLQYNIEALLNSLAGVVSFSLALKNGSTEGPLVTDGNSSGIQAMRSHEDVDDENLIDELSVVYDPSLTGIRVIVDALNGLNEGISFVVINSVDQSLASQLKLLLRVKDIQYWRSNFFKSVMFGVPVVVMTHTEHTAFWKRWMLFPGFWLVSFFELLLASHIQFHLGQVFLKKFLVFIKLGGKNATMDVLVCISTSISYGFSVLSIFLSVWRGQTEQPPKVLFDTVCMLIAFISLGKWLENKAKGATSTALSKLLSLAPTSCTIITDLLNYDNYLQDEKMGDLPTRTIGIDLIQPDDIAMVLPGGKIPADGIITFGETEVDESFVTGESLPVFKKRGDSVIGGSINGPDLIHIKVVRTGKKSQLQQIINLVKDSQVNKAPVQRFADYVAARFVPCVLLLALVTFVFWLIFCNTVHEKKLPMIFNKEVNGKYFVCLKLAISVIVVACPCALGLAAPTAVMVGTGVGAEHGVLIKGGDILEKASSVNVILFDKTGTLTTGNMKVVNSKTSGMSTNDWWSLVGSVECNSEHPIGRAITQHARQLLNLNFEEDTFQTTINDFKVLTGLGIKAVVHLGHNSHKVFVGNNRMIVSMFPHLMETLSKHLETELDTSANTLCHVIIDDEYNGYIELTDALKPHTKEVVDFLTYLENYIVGIVTGDSRAAANRIGGELGISEENIFSEVSPVDKDKVILDIKQRYGPDVGVAFVGDGINDAPALAQADIGIAISSGSDIAIESADIVLMARNNNAGDLFGVPTALKVSQATFNRIKANFVWAAVYNVIMVPFAMGCFLPFNVMLPPVAAGLSMTLSSVSVVISSLMLKNWTPPKIDPSSFDYEMNEVFSLKNSTKTDFDLFKRGGRLTLRKGKNKLWSKLRGLTSRKARLTHEYELVGR